MGFELGQLVWNFSCRIALVAILEPQQLLGNTWLG
jgi:hypothetical protein